jgi:hypothetical protein
MRVVAGISTIFHGFMRLEAGGSAVGIGLNALMIAAGLLLMAGLWTPVSGSALAALELWAIFSRMPIDPWADILLATCGVGMALIGPGAWSLDARLFGWRRITP